MGLILKFSWDESGATAVEYALLVAFIASAIAASVGTLGTQLLSIFTSAAGMFPSGS
ncbi:MAG: Flp family type IVb pilin [Desulfobaccales bacterium]